ncbi:MAG TPA: RNA polymerase sigma factor SigJ [Galbitalea sp.]|jgi:RNA polymerase sigma-70 factor (ECF subfamily)|nr:RNA polymerase sigma factor SigJ [Galbitalea sp.]
MTEQDDELTVDDEVIGERRHLMSLSFRMLGIVAEAEDAVQETYARWYRMSQPERDAIESPRGWLTRVAGRVCLDVLDSARVRREAYVGPWLPESVPLHEVTPANVLDPLDRVTLDDTISTALLLVLESMTPAERVSFVLHDVFAVSFDDIAEIVGRSAAACRQLATSARRRMQSEGTREVSREHHDEVVRAFAAASQTGDIAALIAVLDPNVVLSSDGGGVVSAARRPVVGAENVARFLLGILAKRPDVEIVPQETNDGLGFLMWDEGCIFGVVNFGVTSEAESTVSDIWMLMNPNKLLNWG